MARGQHAASSRSYFTRRASSMTPHCERKIGARFNKVFQAKACGCLESPLCYAFAAVGPFFACFLQPPRCSAMPARQTMLPPMCTSML